SKVGRYTADGKNFDAGFGVWGVTALSHELQDLAASKGGAVLTLQSRAALPLVLQRLTAAGKADAAFGANGSAEVVMPKPMSRGRVAYQNDGRILVTGWTTTPPESYVTRIWD
ncbi:MAG TPA: hypothetical protein VM204_08920, partial [Gaiellaceae bacterium]|nr:hypothetical protein [Gaiellaceae bacterium]